MVNIQRFMTHVQRLPVCVQYTAPPTFRLPHGVPQCTANIRRPPGLKPTYGASYTRPIYGASQHMSLTLASRDIRVAALARQQGASMAPMSARSAPEATPGCLAFAPRGVRVAPSIGLAATTGFEVVPRGVRETLFTGLAATHCTASAPGGV